MNNPFDYEPSSEMLAAQQQLVAHIESLCNENPVFKEEVSKGKMFGILRTHIPGKVEEGLLFAFSGQIGGSFTWPGFVPPVFDYLDEKGYFKVHEREISAINQHIDELELSAELKSLEKEYVRIKAESEEDIEKYRLKMKAAKLERDLIRGKGLTNEASLIRESQFMKAEMHRKKIFWNDQLEGLSAKINAFNGEIRSLKLQRQHKSDALQRWLFEQFVFTIPHTSEKKNLLEIFETYYQENSLSFPKGRVGIGLPPSGSGECCEPKLLYYAIENNLEPIEMGMFWWGESPKQEIRHHLQFYPACNGKCKAILTGLLPAPPKGECLMHKEGLGEVFSDDSIIVVNKPAGMLSVPGRSEKPSVFSLLKERFADCKELQMVHRLDMDTSGLLVVAKTKEAHKNLQRQFAEHTIKKEYLAVLSRPLDKEEGVISLPLRPDFDDRPRQIVDHENGKEAITAYKGNGKLVRLFPQTGRTHQLRVHCAHKEGLDNPIKGDRLYGQKADRLFLHAAYLEFTHPKTQERMKFRVEVKKYRTKKT